jgi:indolepyruvate decarboxylase
MVYNRPVAMTLAAFLFDRLWAHGVRRIFGIPGDFVLNLYEALEADGRFELVRLSHEPAVGFAADGAARATSGLGVCCVTYGAGGLNMINPIACAYAEESPVIVISGGPGRLERQAAVPVHHEVKSFESQLKIYAEVTEYAAILDDPRTAATHISTAIATALAVKRPVYLEVPRDMVSVDIDVPAQIEPLALKVDEGAVREAAQEIAARLAAAVHPVLIVGVEVHRFELRSQVLRLAERLNIPVASSFLGRGVFPTRHPQFIGTYLGVASPPSLREIVESSDCVLLLGELVSDTSLGISANHLDERNLLIAIARDVFIGHHRYERAPIDRVVAQLLDMADLPTMPTRPVSSIASAAAVGPDDTPSPNSGRIVMRDVIAALNEFFTAHPELLLVADTGDALFASVDIQANECIAPAYYATMGFSVPAALGVQIASGRRPVVLVGDGAFQMTGPEISHAPEYRCNPIVVVLNNTGWEMLQAFFPGAGYNRTVSWPFAQLADLWGGRGIRTTTPAQFRDALAGAIPESRFTLIEVPLERGDLSPVLQRFVAAFKARVYVS